MNTPSPFYEAIIDYLCEILASNSPDSTLFTNTAALLSLGDNRSVQEQVQCTKRIPS
jgi:hypothetical protein